MSNIINKDLIGHTIMQFWKMEAKEKILKASKRGECIIKKHNDIGPLAVALKVRRPKDALRI